MVSWFKILTTTGGRGWVRGGVFALFGCGKGEPVRYKKAVDILVAIF
jgi:hypothetical protein